VLKEFDVPAKLRCALSDCTLVLIEAILSSLKIYLVRQNGFTTCKPC
jgi:hypothetical protein